MKKYFVKLFLVCCLLSVVCSPAFALSDKGFQTLDIFTKILHYVENDYVESVDDEKLLRGAIRGLLSNLDPHTVYLSPEVYKELKADTSGIFGGVGLEITVREGWVTVISAVEGTPAYKAGIQPGDRILKINGKSTKEMDLGDAVKEMRGSQGSKVTLAIGRKDLKQPFNVTLNRQIIKVPSVRAELLDGKYLYVKISSFQERTSEDLRKILKKYNKDVEANGLILDMRNNPGGLLDQAVKVSDQFLDGGVIVTTESRKKEVDRKEAAPDADGAKSHFPMIMLANGGSASAAEIVAGALQDHKRALLLGTQTFGKGSVQSIVELDDGSALKLTIAKYFTPSGRSIQALGIKPDILVEPTPPKLAKEKTPPRFQEKMLEGHLKGADEEEGAEKSETESFEEPVVDHQKTVALNYLKTWEAFKEQGTKTTDNRPKTENKRGATRYERRATSDEIRK